MLRKYCSLFRPISILSQKGRQNVILDIFLITNSSIHLSVDGGWTAWGSYSPCTKSCGGGTQFRQRSCTNPRPSHGGKTCTGQARQNHACHTAACPTRPPTTKPPTTAAPTTTTTTPMPSTTPGRRNEQPNEKT